MLDGDSCTAKGFSFCGLFGGMFVFGFIAGRMRVAG